MIVIKSKSEIDKMRRVGKVIARIARKISEAVRPGVTTKELDDFAVTLFNKEKVKSAFLNYNGFPGSICTSVNEVVVHGIPDGYSLKDGDIISIDLGGELDGYFGDMAFTVGCGNISHKAKRLIDVTKQALYKGINVMKEGNHLYDISAKIQSFVERNDFSVVRDLVGHGIGQSLHEDPQIPNFGSPNTGPVLRKGMVFALEPMVNEGSFEVKILNDGWTIVTKDSSLSAHFEHTVALTENGVEILTKE